MENKKTLIGVIFGLIILVPAHFVVNGLLGNKEITKQDSDLAGKFDQVFYTMLESLEVKPQ